MVADRAAGPHRVTMRSNPAARCGSPAEFAVAAGQEAASRNASVMSAHTAEKIISIVTVATAGRSSAVAIALAVVSEELRRPVSSSSR